MGVARNLNLGWYIEFPEKTKIGKVEERLTEQGFKHPDDYIIGIDPINGRQNHIAVPDYQNLTLKIDDEDDTMVICWDQIERMRMTCPEPLIKYVNDVNSIFGDGFATLKFGLIQWYN